MLFWIHVEVMRISEQKRNEIIRGWKKLRNDEIHNLLSSPNIIRTVNSRRMRRAGQAARMRAKRNSYSVSVGKPEGKEPLRSPRHRWNDNIVTCKSIARPRPKYAHATIGEAAFSFCPR
jgi:hypothetical protein